MNLALAKIDAARQALEQATSIPEVKDIRDKAQAIQDYLKQAGASLEAQNHAADLKLRAERKMGELIPKFFPRGGDRKTKSKCHNGTLIECGIEKKQSVRCQKIFSVPESIFEQHVAKTKEDGLELTTQSVLRLAKEQLREEKRRKNQELPEVCCTTSDLDALVQQRVTFGTIYADPPWKYGNQVTRAAADTHYETMTVDELVALPVGELAAKQSHLWLWTTNGFLFECPKLFSAWGFEFKSSYVWVKPQIGIGNYLRNSHEFLLLAVRGGLVGADTNIRSWGEFDRGQHSAKPEQIRRDVVERVSPGPRLELFGRRAIDGWAVWGNQIQRELFTQNIKELSA